MKRLSILLPFVFIILAGCTRERVEPFSKSDLKYLALLPQDAHIVGAMDFSKIRNTEVYDLFKKYADHTPFESDDYELFVEKTGFNMEKDLRIIYFAGTGSEYMVKPRGIFIATGNFSPEKISAFIEEEAEDSKEIVSESYIQFKLYRLRSEDLAFSFADAQTLIGGRDSLVMKCLDRFNNENTVNDDLMEELSPIRYKSQAWIWMNTGKFISALPASELGNRIRSLETIKSGQMSMAMSDEIKFDGICTCGDEQNAEIIQDMVKGAIATAKLNFTDDRDSVDILNKIAVETEGNIVKITFNMTRNEIDHLLKKKGFTARLK